MPTKDQLRSIEWVGQMRCLETDRTCVVCSRSKLEGHALDCWLAAALATPDTLPPVAVGDVVIDESYPSDGLVVRDEAQALFLTLNGRLRALYRTPLWVAKEEG